MLLIRTFIIGLAVLGPVFTADAQLPNAAFFAKSFKPNAFSFTDQTGVALSTVATSNSVALTGIGTRAVTAACSGCTLERNASGAWAASVGGFRKGDTIRIRLTSSGANAATVTSTVSLGGVTSSVWSVTTVAYTYSWYQGGWGACQLNSWAYSGTGSCSVSCGGGTQLVSYTCTASNNSQTQTVYCRRSDSVQMDDSYCSGAGTKPASSQACWQTSCSGSNPSYSQSCNTQSCCSASMGQACDNGYWTSGACDPAKCVTAKVSCGEHVTKHCYTMAPLSAYWEPGWTNSTNCNAAQYTYFNDPPCTTSVWVSAPGTIQCNGSCQ